MTLISGGLNPGTPEASEHAIKYYGNIRGQDTDVTAISSNTGFSYEQISLIKAYIFYAQHDLYDGRMRFAPSFEMAESWRRLRAKDKRHIQPHDILSLQHELVEIDYIRQGYSQVEAHRLASQVYNYSAASKAFYRQQGMIY